MNALVDMWSAYTEEFSTVQKVVIAVVLAFILCIAVLAIVLLIMELTQ